MDELTCKEAYAHLGDYVDRELSEQEIAKVARHLEVCEICLKEFQFEEALIQKVRAKMERVHVPDELRSRLAKALDGVH